MKNLFRALRFVWPYRGRLALSIICALIMALLWGANFMAITPILDLLGKNQNLLMQIDLKIQEKEARIAEWEAVLDGREKEVQKVVHWQESEDRDIELARLTRLQAKDEASVGDARS